MRPTPVLTALVLATTGLALGVPSTATARVAAAPDGSPVAVVDPPAVRPDGAQAATPRAAWAMAAGTDALALHSDPGSQHVLYLDFDGGTVSGTAWPAAANGTEPAFSLDGDPTTFTASERAFVTTVWEWVSEDYAPFDVDVTTEDPGDAAIDRTSSSDPTYGTRVLITPSATAQQAVCGGQCGGAAFVGAFDATGSAHARYQPAWVFPQALPVNAAPDPKYIADAAAHEAGHTLGLSHDGLGSADYYAGRAPWGPIMGDPYDQPLSQWSDGDYTGATETEDDVAVIAASGAPLRADEAGGTVVTAAPASAGPVAGIIGDRTDVDDYALGACSGTVTLTAAPAAVGPDLDISLSLLRADGSVIATADPTTARVSSTQASNLGASITASVPAGTAAFAAVDGGGLGTPDTGYSDYGSLGRYTLSSTGCTAGGGSGGGTSTAPGAPTSVAATVSGTTARLTWAAPTDPGPGVTGYQVSLDGRVVATTDATTTAAVVSGLARGTTATLEVRALAGTVTGAPAATQVAVPAGAPSAPGSPVARSGAAGGTITASVRWTAPVDDGGAAVAGYRVVATLLDAAGHVTGTGRLTLPASATGVVARFPRASRVRFVVQARNAVGWGALSRASAVVRAR